MLIFYMTGDGKMMKKMQIERFIVLFSSTTILCLALLAAIPLGWLLPASWGQENGPIENLQVIVILSTAIISFIASRRGVGSPEMKQLFLWSIPVSVIIAARELSWGRVFYPDGHGWFLPLKALWYGRFVYPAIGIIMAIVLIGIYLQRLDQELLRWARYGKFPIVDIVLIIGGFFAADFVEHHTYGYFASYQDLFEELFELVMYCGVFSLFTNLGFKKHFQPDSDINDKQTTLKMPNL